MDSKNKDTSLHAHLTCMTRMFNMADEDFQEEVVWSFGKDRRGDVSKREPTLFTRGSSSSTAATSSGSRMIPRANAYVEENAHAHPGRNYQRQSSAPVNIPDWSKVYNGRSSVVVDDDDDDDDDRVLPPHEWLAKKLARSRISSFSVCEGAGRTLKGRDQAKVRNAVLTRTGFLE